MYAHKQHFQDKGSLRDKAKNKTYKKRYKSRNYKQNVKDVWSLDEKC